MLKFGSSLMYMLILTYGITITFMLPENFDHICSSLFTLMCLFVRMMWMTRINKYQWHISFLCCENYLLMIWKCGYLISRVPVVTVSRNRLLGRVTLPVWGRCLGNRKGIWPVEIYSNYTRGFLWWPDTPWSNSRWEGLLSRNCSLLYSLWTDNLTDW